MTTGRNTSGLVKIVITFLSNTLEVGEFKNANQDLIRDWSNLRHEDLRVAP